MLTNKQINYLIIILRRYAMGSIGRENNRMLSTEEFWDEDNFEKSLETSLIKLYNNRNTVREI